MAARKARAPVASGVRVRVFSVIDRAVEEGVARGWNRAHKHTETPGEQAIRDAIAQAVLDELCGVLAFDDE